jgi:antitoxin component YwqK of YwqJK toxin-antitoxin module
MSEHVLNIVEMVDANGRVKCRYSRAKCADGTKWIRQGRFVSYHPNGVVESEGTYVDDLEEGHWRDFYANGVLAAEGSYKCGKEHGVWHFWSEDGTSQPAVAYRDGEEVLTSAPFDARPTK